MGCARLKGEAKSIDLATLMYENKRMMVKWAKFMHFIEEQFSDMKSEIKRTSSNKRRLDKLIPSGKTNPPDLPPSDGTHPSVPTQDLRNFGKMLTVNGTSNWSPRSKAASC
eukprot:gnl/MRDRNA2_/MRDRNA2_121520_c0_seq1.p2 gnl/MRDRNA2_/MRDRNA2_121520_c0~~gnl/MRDRNA2_/MRDRNA2_121520_c0_seq1.p2  ORF type:complete len:111 (-),score=23.88 gnl/MRDRNA2_/MRDRNA2_121520_c0_seq1:630-962(-)